MYIVRERHIWSAIHLDFLVLSIDPYHSVCLPARPRLSAICEPRRLQKLQWCIAYRKICRWPHRVQVQPVRTISLHKRKQRQLPQEWEDGGRCDGWQEQQDQWHSFTVPGTFWRGVSFSTGRYGGDKPNSGSCQPNTTTRERRYLSVCRFHRFYRSICGFISTSGILSGGSGIMILRWICSGYLNYLLLLTFFTPVSSLWFFSLQARLLHLGKVERHLTFVIEEFVLVLHITSVLSCFHRMRTL